MDVRDLHLYVLSEDNYSLYIFSIDFRQARLVKNYKLAKRWWLLSPETEAPNVKQILLSTANPFPSVLTEPLLSKRGFLQLHSSRGEKVRASSNFLVIESLRDPTCDLLTFDAESVNDYSTQSSIGFYKVETGLSQPSPRDRGKDTHSRKTNKYVCCQLRKDAANRPRFVKQGNRC